MRALPLALIVLMPLQAVAQEAPPVGTILLPQAPTVLYDRPPNAVFGEASAPTAVVRGGDQGAELFRVKPDAANPGSFAVAPDAPVDATGLKVLGSVEVYKGDQLQRWIQVAPQDAGGNEVAAELKGWTVYNPSTLSPDM